MVRHRYLAIIPRLPVTVHHISGAPIYSNGQDLKCRKICFVSSIALVTVVDSGGVGCEL